MQYSTGMIKFKLRLISRAIESHSSYSSQVYAPYLLLMFNYCYITFVVFISVLVAWNWSSTSSNMNLYFELIFQLEWVALIKLFLIFITILIGLIKLLSNAIVYISVLVIWKSSN